MEQPKKIAIKMKSKTEKKNLQGLAITITYSECVENHHSMMKHGLIAANGITFNDLVAGMKKFEEAGLKCEMHHLNEALIETEYDNEAKDAYLLIIRNGVDFLLKDIGLTKSDMMMELTSFDWDTKALMRGKVVNKHARHNVCFAESSQTADFANGKGTIIPFDKVLCTNHIRQKLPNMFGPIADHLLAEGNKYNDVAKNGIGFHGDFERKKVIGVRIGQSFPLHYQWFIRFKPVGKRIEFMLNDGDIYVMSEKAVGKDWRCSSLLTLRHAAGADQYLIIKDK